MTHNNFQRQSERLDGLVSISKLSQTGNAATPGSLSFKFQCIPFAVAGTTWDVWPASASVTCKNQHKHAVLKIFKFAPALSKDLPCSLSRRLRVGGGGGGGASFGLPPGVKLLLLDPEPSLYRLLLL